MGVLGKVFIAFWKRCGHREPSDVELRSSARAAPLEATRGAPMAVHSLFHAFFYSVHSCVQQIFTESPP